MFYKILSAMFVTDTEIILVMDYIIHNAVVAYVTVRGV